MMIKGHTEKLFFYITELNQYLIIINLPWLHHHAIDVNFEHNTLIMFFSFCLAHCCSFSVKIYNTTQKEKKFLFFKKSQQIWKLQNQKNLTEMNDVSPNSALSLKKTFSIQSAHKKQSSHSVTHKGQSSIQSAHKKQSSHSVAHKRQSSIQSAHKEQFSHLVIYKKQLILIQAE